MAVQESGDEAAGFRLANIMSQELRREFVLPEPTAVPEGPYFVYDTAPTLFLGRRGWGPLRIAWDTNLLIDYLEHGRALWDGAPPPDTIPEDYAAELEGLQLVLSLWVMRDIRFYIPERVLADGKRALDPDRHEGRLRALEEFSRAVSLIAWGDNDESPPPLHLPPSEHRRVVDLLPRGADQELVAEVLTSGVHVFMTRDEGILKARDALRPFGLLVATPFDVLEELTACGALSCLLEPRFAYWPVPDLQRVTHLIRALPVES